MNSILLNRLVKVAPVALAAFSILLMAHGLHAGTNGDVGGSGGPNLHVISSGDVGGNSGPN